MKHLRVIEPGAIPGDRMNDRRGLEARQAELAARQPFVFKTVLAACRLHGAAIRGPEHLVPALQAEGIEARPTAGDLTEPDIARLAVETALKHFGRLDVVVNVAGGLTSFGPIEQVSAQAFDREVAINLKTTFLVSQAAVSALEKTGGVIVNFASIAYFKPQNQMAAYAAAKSAVAAFTQSLALELRDRGVRLALASMVSGQFVMVLLMTMTPLHIRHEGHGLGAIGLVIAAHTLGMYALSPVTGRLGDPHRMLTCAGLADLPTDFVNA